MLPALIAGGLGLVGGILANRSNARQAEKQMDFQEEMSNTSYQRGVKDMMAAGINPMLSAKVGGASAPPGAAAHMENVAPAAVSSAQSAVAMQAATAGIDKTRADTDLSLAQAAKLKAETMNDVLYRERFLAGTENLNLSTALKANQALTARQQAELVAQQYQTERQNTELRRNQAAHEGVRLDVSNSAFAADVEARKLRAVLMALGVPEAEANAAMYKNPVGQYAPWVEKIMSVVRGVSSARASGPPVYNRTVNINRGR